MHVFRNCRKMYKLPCTRHALQQHSRLTFNYHKVINVINLDARVHVKSSKDHSLISAQQASTCAHVSALTQSRSANLLKLHTTSSRTTTPQVVLRRTYMYMYVPAVHHLSRDLLPRPDQRSPLLELLPLKTLVPSCINAMLSIIPLLLSLQSLAFAHFPVPHVNAMPSVLCFYPSPRGAPKLLSPSAHPQSSGLTNFSLLRIPPMS